MNSIERTEYRRIAVFGGIYNNSLASKRKGSGCR